MTPQEKLRQNQRALRKAQQEISRQVVSMERQEKKLLGDIKKAAKEGQTSACKIMAKDLVRTRRYSKKYATMRTSLQALEMRLQRLTTSQQMSTAVLEATKAMRSMNSGMNLPGIQKVLMDFERESGMMDMKEEMIDETMDDAMQDDEEDEEEESEEVVKQVLDEIGIQLNQSLGSVPTNIAGPASNENALDDDAALQARLENLRRE
ncbi:ESCRT-III subunit protein did4 [Coemansia sp. RSA 1822]|nr:ESCRT-III subunit protein did4 [Coemansia sp. RSA 638]KAJ2123385.1 ESCRT-III subunit protein did4 [Coemansia sp. RSA 720]KAJ2478767.1 ESCRT-III subunit protein did4 [Coemansia sp. RSA 2131]KAJ2542844.1 ESCRT-III subunit protein did4 [Coemansia sp. RSA 1853]KAJ2562372.1 ESCRT-III subunit protein did4 [Coemansia sp. RSA 1822]KAJ2660190.1 ESCRT-III subunit protein did4 [Coemansia sp. RSA 1199]